MLSSHRRLQLRQLFGGEEFNSSFASRAVPKIEVNPDWALRQSHHRIKAHISCCRVHSENDMPVMVRRELDPNQKADLK